MDADLQALALAIAGNLWRGVRHAHQTLTDVDDLRQEALVAAWEWEREHPDWNATPRDRSTAARAIRYDVVDYLRSTGGRPSREDTSVWSASHRQPRSLDEPVHTTAGRFAGGGAERDVSLGDLLHDDGAQDAYERVETQADVHRAFAQHLGHPRDAAAAWLSLHGVPLADIGAHFGVTESRACQYRSRFISATAERWAAAEREAERQAA